MSYIDFDGLFYYNDKIKKYIEKKIEESKTDESTSSIDNTEVSNHIKNNNIHVTTLEKNKWNNKLDRTDLTDYAKTSDIPDITGKADKTYVDVELNKKANKTDVFSGSYNDLTDKPTIPDISNLATKTEVATHTNDTDIHITFDERTKWDSKLDSNALNGYATEAYVSSV